MRKRESVLDRVRRERAERSHLEAADLEWCEWHKTWHPKSWLPELTEDKSDERATS